MSAKHRNGAAPAEQTLHPSFFAKYTILRHEKSKDFERLLQGLNESYEPQSPAEELSVLRLAQVYWRLRRVDTMEAAVYESQVEQARKQVPTAHPAAVLAAEYLCEDTPVLERFRLRMQKQREDMERQADRIATHLLRLKKEREGSEVRALRNREDAPAVPAAEKSTPSSASNVSERNAAHGEEITRPESWDEESWDENAEL